MTPDEVRQAVAEGVAQGVARALAVDGVSKGVCACCGTCELEHLEHRDHHKALGDIGLSDMCENHRFIKEARETLKRGRRVVMAEIIKHAVTALVTGAAMYATLKGSR